MSSEEKGNEVQVRVIEDKNPAQFASWLSSETEEVVVAIDGGDFERPITEQSVVKGWEEIPSVILQRRSWNTLSHHVFTAQVSSEDVGHVELAVVQVQNEEAKNSFGGYCGKEPFALLMYVYVVPQWRAKGVGTSMVREVCEFAVRKSAAVRVALLVQEDNERAKKFYHRCGFKDTGITTIKRDCVFNLFAYETSYDSSPSQ
eukprot:CAMPEP_0201535168 /NCGR_PEP_ID=MMETSP0161_2-20130828/58284_1 /ASSEMBLY_ACC=CAM_ASM_000251 /TAXON_ID=180227 /ORGANISM="Neoparamoeba aestuarina, Strain SoJaBio B1-5/56/2" /LENGTH=201 /DNA_ID=CAMNT_0047940187 /DNA_START=39 /DNA_END=644 /DNA_ORIENTATION=+